MQLPDFPIDESVELYGMDTHSFPKVGAGKLLYLCLPMAGIASGWAIFKALSFIPKLQFLGTLSGFFSKLALFNFPIRFFSETILELGISSLLSI